MILKTGEKIHIIHRRLIEKEAHRHFVGVVDYYEAGIARVTGHIFAVDRTKFSFVRRPEPRTRIVALYSGDLLVNVLPESVNLDKIVYKPQKSAVRVTDGSDWYMDLSEVTWM